MSGNPFAWDKRRTGDPWRSVWRVPGPVWRFGWLRVLLARVCGRLDTQRTETDGGLSGAILATGNYQYAALYSPLARSAPLAGRVQVFCSAQRGRAQDTAHCRAGDAGLSGDLLSRKAVATKREDLSCVSGGVGLRNRFGLEDRSSRPSASNGHTHLFTVFPSTPKAAANAFGCCPKRAFLRGFIRQPVGDLTGREYQYLAASGAGIRLATGAQADARRCVSAS
jgi:hypothetical protein